MLKHSLGMLYFFIYPSSHKNCRTLTPASVSPGMMNTEAVIIIPPPFPQPRIQCTSYCPSLMMETRALSIMMSTPQSHPCKAESENLEEEKML